MGFKLNIFSIFFFIFYVIIILRILDIQFNKKNFLLNYANQQIIKEMTILPPRGMIFDRDQNILAMNKKVYDIVLIPRNKNLFLNSITSVLKYLNISNNTILSEVKKRKKYTVILPNKELSEENIEYLKKIEGIFLEEKWIRYYPHDSFLSKTLGFVGNENKGLAGIEYFLDEQLRGTPEKIMYHQDAKGRPLKIDLRAKGDLPQSVTLTISKKIQNFLEESLQELLTKSQSNFVGGFVVDVYSGEILAMSHLPQDNLNSRKKNFFTQPLVTDILEPGSVLKPLIVSILLDHQMIDEHTKIFCENGQYLLSGHFIKEASLQKHKWLSIKEILKKSSNIGMVKLVEKLPIEFLENELEKFGFFNKTGIELAGESRGSKPFKKGPLEKATLSFGQGLSATPIQLIQAYLVLASGGLLIKPTLIKKDKPIFKRVIKLETSNKITSLLQEVIEDGTGKKAQLNYLKLAGKTSTAQKIIKGKYQQHISSIIAFSANDDDRFLVMIYADEPKIKNYFAGTLIAPYIKKIANNVFLEDNYLKIYKKNNMTDNISFLGLSRDALESTYPNYKFYYNGEGVVTKSEKLTTDSYKIFLGDPFQ